MTPPLFFQNFVTRGGASGVISSDVQIQEESVEFLSIISYKSILPRGQNNSPPCFFSPGNPVAFFDTALLEHFWYLSPFFGDFFFKDFKFYWKASIPRPPIYYTPTFFLVRSLVPLCMLSILVFHEKIPIGIFSKFPYWKRLFFLNNSLYGK